MLHHLSILSKLGHCCSMLLIQAQTLFRFSFKHFSSFFFFCLLSYEALPHVWILVTNQDIEVFHHYKETPWRYIPNTSLCDHRAILFYSNFVIWGLSSQCVTPQLA